MSDLLDLLRLAADQNSVRLNILPDTMHDAFMLAYHRGLIRAYVPITDHMIRRKGATPDRADPRVLWANRGAVDMFDRVEGVDVDHVGITSPVFEITQAGLAALAEAREGTERKTSAPRRATAWTPPTGYVGVKTICNDERFRKNGKSPPRTTIDVWLKSDKLVVHKDPATQEVHVPESWILDRISRWTPRT